MPSERPGDSVRIVVDETSLYFEGVTDDAAEAALDDFNETLSRIIRSGTPVGKVSFCYEFEARMGLPLEQFLYTRATLISPDTLRRCGDLLDRCFDWDDDNDHIPDMPCRIDGQEIEAWSICYAVAGASTRPMACIACSVAGRSGLKNVEVSGSVADIFFICHGDEVRLFWQHVLSSDLVPQADFFEIAEVAFPKVALAAELDFRAFHGSYETVYSWVVKVLIVLNEHMIESFQVRRGVRQDVISDVASHGVEISPESPKTRKNTRAMAQRSVSFDGESYMCEWHAKRLWNVDRIHFTTPGELPDGRILVGRFADHLET